VVGRIAIYVVAFLLFGLLPYNAPIYVVPVLFAVGYVLWLLYKDDYYLLTLQVGVWSSLAGAALVAVVYVAARHNGETLQQVSWRNAAVLDWLLGYGITFLTLGLLALIVALARRRRPNNALERERGQ
jgi:hypothetical protein